MNKKPRRKRPSWYTPVTPVPRRAAVGGSRARISRECRECFGFPYHATGCPKSE